MGRSYPSHENGISRYVLRIGLLALCLLGARVAEAVPPLPPQLGDPSGTIVDASPTFDWQASAGATSYTLALRDVTAASYVFVQTGLTGSTFPSPVSLDTSHAYRWKMSAVNADGGSGWSGWQSFDYGQTPDPPPMPQLVGPGGTIADLAPTFEWQTSPGATSYSIALRDVSASTYVLVLGGLTGTTFDSPVSLDTTHLYRWKMAAIGPGGSSGWTAWLDFDYGGLPDPPSAPTLNDPIDTTRDRTPLFEWGAETGATSYSLALRDLTAGAYVFVRTGLSGTSFESPAVLDAQHEYRWKMTAVGPGGASPWSGWQSFVFPPSPFSPFSLRFRGNGTGDIDRVKFPIDDPSTSVPGPSIDVGAGDFTIEFWMRAAAIDNSASAVSCGSDNSWIGGNIVIDRDRYNQDRSFGISIAGGTVAFGVTGDGTGSETICGSTSVVDDAWHHIVVQRRRSDGFMWLYVDGVLDSSRDGPDGDISYPDNGIPCGNCCGGSSCSFSDPFLVIGAEKHDADPVQYPSFTGYADEIRISSVLRYSSNFSRPTGPFSPDADTLGLYHFDEGNGDRIVDASGHVDGTDGERRYGGSPAGPDWSTETPFPPTVSLNLDLVTSGLDVPVAIAHAGDNRIFIAERDGRILIFDGVGLLPTPFLDIESIVWSGDERGLLGLAFHPNYAANGYFYVSYTDLTGDSVVERYSRQSANVAAPGSGDILIDVPQPFANHNGGQLAFGPDGYLYFGIGDGGSGGDPGCVAQRDDSYLGKILRLDVDQSVGAPPYYGIPPDNPHIGPGLPLDEIWSKGWRNPWRFTFDSLTGGMFVGDVGQSALEEVSYQPATSIGGENYGWKIMEGMNCFGTGSCAAGIPVCNDPSLVQPILQYLNPPDACASVTGGYVYRGTQAPQLEGVYVYGDYCFGDIWGARQNDGVWSDQTLSSSAPNLYTFGEGADGELYVASGGNLFRVE